MGEAQLVSQANLVAMAGPEACGAPFTDPVEREDGRLLEWTGKEGAGGVAFVMVWENQRRSAPGYSPAQASPQAQFLFQPKRHCSSKTDEAAGREGQVR